MTTPLQRADAKFYAQHAVEGHFAHCVLQIYNDGSLYLLARNPEQKTYASKRFTPAQVIALRHWLMSSPEWSHDSSAETEIGDIRYSHETGLIELHSARGSRSFDPASDEDLARFVRLLKSLAPLPKSLAPTLPLPFPTPTDEDLARAQRFTNAAFARGYSGQATGRASAARPISTERAREKLDALFDGLVIEQNKRKI